MNQTLPLCFLVLACCGGDKPTDEPDESSETLPHDEPTSCARPRGRYEITFTERSGNCGQQASMIATLPDEVNAAIGTWNPSCTDTSRDLSDNDCTYDADATCVGALTAAQMTLCQSLGGCRNPD